MPFPRGTSSRGLKRKDDSRQGTPRSASADTSIICHAINCRCASNAEGRTSERPGHAHNGAGHEEEHLDGETTR